MRSEITAMAATTGAPPPLAVRPSLSGARLKAYLLCLEAYEFDRACAIAVKLRPSALAKPLREAARCEEAYLKLTDTSPGPRLGFVQLHLKERYAASITDLQSCAVALRGHAPQPQEERLQQRPAASGKWQVARYKRHTLQSTDAA